MNFFISPMKRIIRLLIIVLVILFSFPGKVFANELIASLILPPSSSVLQYANNKEVILANESSAHQKTFPISNADIFVHKDYFGARIAMPSYYIYFRPFSRLSVRENMELIQGSIWVKAMKGGGDFSMKLGSLMLNAQEGEFLFYISPDKTDLAVKVLAGSVRVKHVSNGQEITVEKERMTRLDSQGYLIAPLPIEPDLITKWWNFDAYDESRSLPVANAGEDQYILDQSTVTMNGLNSIFNDGDIFEWTLTEGPVAEVIYDTTDITRPSFTPPASGVYTFSLVIVSEEGIRSEPDIVRVFVGENYLSSVQYFDDVKADDPKTIAINYLRKHGVISGYKDAVTGKSFFYPKSPVTRAQVLKVFFLGSNMEIPGIAEGTDTGFIDVDRNEWYAPYVRFAKDKEIIKGNPDGMYRPNQPVNRAAALKIVLEINKANVASENVEMNYSDVPKDAWFAPYMAFAYKNKLFDADQDGLIRPDAEMTRDEVAELMYRLIKAQLVGARGKLSGYVMKSDGATAVSGAVIQIYSTKQNTMMPTSESVKDPQRYLEADSLIKTIDSSEDGSFTAMLPVGFYSVRVLDESGGGQKSFTIEIQSQKTTSVMLEVK